MNELNFDLDVVEVPVTVGTQKFVLREASGEAGRRYDNAQHHALKVNDGRVVGFGDIADADGILLSSCLFRCDENGNPTEQRVGMDTIAKWPNKVVKSLVQKCKEISDLDLAESVEDLKRARDRINERIKKKESLGNEPVSTPDGSG